MADPGLGPTWKVTRWWLIVAGVLVTIPYCIVWSLTSWDYAFEVVTGTVSPFREQHVGPAGAILGSIGYLLIPVVVGSVAAVWFSMNVRRAYGSDLAKQILKEVADEAAKDQAAKDQAAKDQAAKDQAAPIPVTSSD